MDTVKVIYEEQDDSRRFRPFNEIPIRLFTYWGLMN
jgi:hypothetical protein